MTLNPKPSSRRKSPMGLNKNLNPKLLTLNPPVAGKLSPHAEEDRGLVTISGVPSFLMQVLLRSVSAEMILDCILDPVQNGNDSILFVSRHCKPGTGASVAKTVPLPSRSCQRRFGAVASCARGHLLQDSNNSDSNSAISNNSNDNSTRNNDRMLVVSKKAAPIWTPKCHNPYS